MKCDPPGPGPSGGCRVGPRQAQPRGRQGREGPPRAGSGPGGNTIYYISVLCSAVPVKPLQATRKSITGKLPLHFFFLI